MNFAYHLIAAAGGRSRLNKDLLENPGGRSRATKDLTPPRQPIAERPLVN